MEMNPSSPCGPKFITPLRTPHLHAIREPLTLPEFQASGLLQKGAEFQSSLPDLGFPPQNVHPCGTTDVRSLIAQACRGRAGRCQGDSSFAMGEAELMSGPGSPWWPGLKMLTFLHIDKVNAGICLCILDVGLYLRIRSQFANGL